MTADGKKYQVFLSYNDRHRPLVDELARWLVREGVTPFFDWWELVPGAPAQEARERALLDSACCAVLIGAGDAAVGPWQGVEVRAAIDLQVNTRAGGYRVIPVLLPGAEWKADAVPSFLRQNEPVAFEATLDDAEALRRLSCGILGRPPGPGPVPVVAGKNPYRGLEVFDRKHAPLFFGREKLTLDLVAMLRPALEGATAGVRLLMVLGPSGSGKSSLVRAGLCPALEQGALGGGPDSWRFAIFKPGADPLENLAVELSKLPGADGLLARTRDVLGIGRFGADAGSPDQAAKSLNTAAKLALPGDDPDARLLVVVDQFEELFTLCKSEQDRRGLIANLLRAAVSPEGRVVVVLTMRADFFGRCAEDRDLADAVSGRQKLVGPMTENELRWAIEKPAALAGGEVDPGLTELLIDEVSGRAGTLPLLEFALGRLWETRTGRRITVAQYNGIGKLEGALGQRADTILARLRARGLEETCRSVFLALIRPGEGTEDTRQRLAYADLVAADPTRSAVVEELVRERLLTAGSPDDPTHGTVEVVHEALIQRWATLRTWIDAARENLLTRDRLKRAAREWAAAGERNRSDYLLTGTRLAVATEWFEKNAGELNRTEAAFLDDSRAAEKARQDIAEENELRLRQALDAARDRAAEAREQAALAHREQERAERLARVSTSRQLAVQAVSESDRRLDRALLLSLEALRAWPTPEARDSLIRGVLAKPGLEEFWGPDAGIVADVAFSPDGKTLAIGSMVYGPVSSGVVTFVDTATGRHRGPPFVFPEGYVVKARFSPDGKALAVKYNVPALLGPLRTGMVLCDPTTGERRWTNPSPDGELIWCLAFSPDGESLAVGVTVAGTPPRSRVEFQDVATGRPRGAPLAVDEGVIRGLAFSPDGKALAAAYGDFQSRRGGVILWDTAASTRTGAPLAVEGSYVNCVAFSPDGKALAGCYGDASGPGGLVVWDAATGQRRLRPFESESMNIKDVLFDAGGKTVVLGLNTKYMTLRVGVQFVSVATGRARGALLSIAEGKEPSLALSPDGTRLALGFQGITAKGPGGVALIDTATARRWGRTLDVSAAGVDCVAYSPDGKTLAAGYSVSRPPANLVSGGVALWDAATGRPRREPLDVAEGGVTSVAFSPDGTTLAAGSMTSGLPAVAYRGGVTFWDTATGRQVRALGVAEGGVGVVAFSPDGTTLAAGFVAQGGPHPGLGVVLCDAATGAPGTRALGIAECILSRLAYHPGGAWFALGFSNSALPMRSGVALRDASTAEARGPALDVAEGYVSSVAFSPDGHTLAAGYGLTDYSYQVSGGVKLWDAATGQPRGEPLDVAEGGVSCVAFSPDGLTLAAGYFYGSFIPSGIVLWDLATGRRLGGKVFEVTDGYVTSVAFSPDGKALAAGLKGDGHEYLGAVVLVDLDPDSWDRTARRIANRNLSWAEWQQFFPGEPYRKTFDDLPAGDGVPADEVAPEP